jgi:penicillin amidase
MQTAHSVFRALLGARLPITNTTLKVAGITRPVTIRRDAFGIPYVEAENDDDGWYGFGFAQGQDRAFQLEAMIRIVRGTLSELVGAEMLSMDRLSRRIGFHRAGIAQFARMSPAVRAQLAAFARGVNDGVAKGSDGKAHELAMLLAEPTPYTAADIVGAAAFVSFAIASNWDAELARLRTLLADGPEALAAIDPTYPAWLPVTHPVGELAGDAADRLAEDLARLRGVTGGGSNNWVLSGARTKSGRPILACDPHLPPAIPPLWYVAHVRTPSFAVSGACMVAQPGFSFGHNGHAAWGPTASHHDNTDLFVEEMGADGRSVREGDRFVPCEARREVIKVRGAADFVEEVLVTRRGPIVGPAFGEEVGAVSMSATWLAPKGYEAAYQLHRVRSFDDVRRIHDPYPGISLSYVYADVTGKIGWTLVGDIPVRKKGSGTVPLHGSDPEVGWEDACVPAADVPHAEDPACGFLASANNQPTPSGSTPFLGVDWLDGYRVSRIVERLSERRDWDLASTLEKQQDPKSKLWDELQGVVLALPKSSPGAAQAIEMLRHWSGSCAATSSCASVFELFVAEMVRRIVERKAPKSAEIALGLGPNAMLSHTTMGARRVSHFVSLMKAEAPGVFSRAWPDEMSDALATVVADLTRDHGEDPNAWAWGRVRTLTLPHFAGQIPGLGRVFNVGPVPIGGDVATIPQASVDFLEPTGNPLGIVAMRLVFDVGDWDETRVVLAGGESGNPMSPHYADLFELWQKGEYAKLAWSPEAVAKQAVETLKLEPG